MTAKDKREYVTDFTLEAVNLGIMLANKSLQPLEDRLKKKDSAKWCELMGIKPTVINALVDQGAIKEYRNGSGSNAAIFYSRAEIHAALFKEHIITGFAGKYPELSFI